MPVAEVFTLWCETRCGGVTWLYPSEVERVTRATIRAVLEDWARHPDAVGREHGDPVVAISEKVNFFDTAITIRATLGEVTPC